MANGKIQGDEFGVDVNLGVLIAITFVSFEAFLLPLFEFTRESLTIALVRYRIAKGKPVTICSEKSIPVALGLSDGLYGRSAFIVIPRALKIFFKVALIFSVFAWELHLEIFERAEVVPFQFNSRGPRGPKAQSSAIFPLPIEGVSDTARNEAASPLPIEGISEATGRNGTGRTGFNLTRFSWKYTFARVPGIDLQYNAHCVKIDELGRRVAYIAIYSHDKLGQRKIYCLNGTHSGEKAEVLSYNPNPEGTLRHRVTSISLQRDGDSISLYSAEVNIITADGLNRTLTGFLKAQLTTILNRMKNRKNGTRIMRRKRKRKVLPRTKFPVFGLLMNSSGTIMKLGPSKNSLDFANITCKLRISSNETRYTAAECLKHYRKIQHLKLQFASSKGPHVEDIDLHLTGSRIFTVGTPINVIHAWMKTARIWKIGSHFRDDLWHIFSGDMFYFFQPKEKQLLLRVGESRKQVRMKKWPTVCMLVVVSLFFAYSLSCLLLKYHSRIHTGISSDCVTRSAMLEFIGREASMQGTLLLDDFGTSKTFALSHAGPTREHLRLVSAENVEECSNMKFMRLGDRVRGYS